jgi:VIT1/CCC1 family predicted Fe2+/Mn2+ transporter
MKPAQKTGIAFGLTSGVITTLGVIIGLNAATSLRLAVVGGILTVAISDAFSDALGIHISQEASGKSSHSEVWQATFATFFSKLLVALTFLLPVLIFPLDLAIKADLAWGLILIITFNYYLAKSQKKSPSKIIAEHLAIAAVVIAITYYIGKLISIYF